MNKTDKVCRYLLAILFLISLFLALDCSLLPLEKVKGVVVSKTESRFSQVNISLLRNHQRERVTLTVSVPVYNQLRENDTILLGRSHITGSPLHLTVYKTGGTVYDWYIGFIAYGGLDFLLFEIISTGLYLFVFYFRIQQPHIRRDITVFLTAVFCVFIVLYLLFR
jgi:hypothetical protein